MVKLIQNIAIYNGLDCHYEMFGYLIHFCYINKLRLIIYTNFEKDNGWLNFYKFIFNKKYKFAYKNIECFKNENRNFDLIFLATDDDFKFNDTDTNINNRTIRIDHYYIIRRPQIEKYIAVRPFLHNYRRWAIPCFPLVGVEEKERIMGSNIINIGIVGSTMFNYNVDIINRIKSINNEKIIINVISRTVSKKQFNGLKDEFILNIFENTNTLDMFDILSECHYILTDITNNKNYSSDVMQGVIPLAFTCLTPLIISKVSNQCYKFKNVIEYMDEDIILKKVNLKDLFEERKDLINSFSKNVAECLMVL